jgi:GrpB-like predicted nucleotidyltransferase (UPF0157 family)
MDSLGPALTNILSDHLSGKPIECGLWQNLDDRDRLQLSEAIVAGRSGTGDEVRICSYDPQWPHVFARIAQEVRAQVGGLVVSIEHVGSTAVPGLAAKPIIDVELVIACSYQFPPVKERLEKFGYIHRGPCGVPDREVFRCVIDLPVHHLYVSETEARPLIEHLRFRNALRQNPELAAEYAALKQALADRYRHDRNAYTEGKTGFIRSVIDSPFAQPN